MLKHNQSQENATMREVTLPAVQVPDKNPRDVDARQAFELYLNAAHKILKTLGSSPRRELKQLNTARSRLEPGGHHHLMVLWNSMQSELQECT
jgi:hypothetical protein